MDKERIIMEEDYRGYKLSVQDDDDNGFLSLKEIQEISDRISKKVAIYISEQFELARKKD